jgi:predicted  nucleic acid-binding Zn-ribbon protein
MDAIEAATASVEDARSQLAVVEAAWRNDQLSLQDEKSRAERETASLDEERRKRTAGMDAGSLGQYENLRTHRQGRAVARLERGACGGCRISLPTHIVQRVRSGDGLVNCPSCERILVSA